jgi:parallel beta-helix repeat protein
MHHAWILCVQSLIRSRVIRFELTCNVRKTSKGQAALDFFLDDVTKTLYTFCQEKGALMRRAINREGLRRYLLGGTRTALAIVAIFFPATARARTLTAGNCPRGAFATIQSAVDTANPGDTVQVCPGFYPEQVTITKPPTVKGIAVANADAAVILPPAGGLVANATDVLSALPEAAQVLVQTPQGQNGSISVTLRGLTVDGIGNGVSSCAPVVTGILYQNASGTIAQVVARNHVLSTNFTGCQSGFGLRVESSDDAPGVASVIVQNSAVRDYQKNGITALGTNTSVQITSNTVRGLGPTDGAAENGIQVGPGASGTVKNNQVIDNVWTPATIDNPEAAATGILIFGSSNVTVTGNTVGKSQFGIATDTSSSFVADHNAIRTNTILGTRIFDGIELCSNNNTVASNTISSSDEAGVHLDSRCGGTGRGNSVTRNTINEACAGILAGTGTSGNSTSPNTLLNVTNMLLNADQCPAPAQSTPASDRQHPA